MSGFKTTQELLEETPVRRLVIHLGIPAMFGQLFNILYNIVDRNILRESAIRVLLMMWMQFPGLPC